MYSHVFICLNFDLYISVLTMYAFVYGYKQNALLLMGWDAIKAIQDIPVRNLKRKKIIESSESESMEKDMTPKPYKKTLKSRALPTESDDDV